MKGSAMGILLDTCRFNVISTYNKLTTLTGIGYNKLLYPI